MGHLVAGFSRAAVGGGGGSLPYTTGLWAHYDAALGVYEDAGTDPAENADLVAQWNDQSGNNRHATQTSSTERPDYFSSGGANNLPYLRFAQGSSGTEFLSPPSMAALTSGEVFVVWKSAADPAVVNQSGHWNMGTSAQGGHYPFTDGKIYETWGTNTRKVTAADVTENLAAWHHYNVESGSGNYKMRVAGNSVLTTGTNTVGFPAAPKFGEGLAGNSNGLDIAELIIYDHVLAALDRADVIDYLETKYGL